MDARGEFAGPPALVPAPALVTRCCRGPSKYPRLRLSKHPSPRGFHSGSLSCSVVPSHGPVAVVPLFQGGWCTRRHLHPNNRGFPSKTLSEMGAWAPTAESVQTAEAAGDQCWCEHHRGRARLGIRRPLSLEYELYYSLLLVNTGSPIRLSPTMRAHGGSSRVLPV